MGGVWVNNHQSQTVWVQILAPPLPSWVTLGKLTSLCISFHVQIGDNSSANLKGLLQELNEIMWRVYDNTWHVVSACGRCDVYPDSTGNKGLIPPATGSAYLPILYKDCPIWRWLHCPRPWLLSGGSLHPMADLWGARKTWTPCLSRLPHLRPLWKVSSSRALHGVDGGLCWAFTSVQLLPFPCPTALLRFPLFL